MRGVDNCDSFALHNGLFGPATTVFHAVVDATRNGLAHGVWEAAMPKWR